MPNTRGINYKVFYALEEEGRDQAITETRCLWCSTWSYLGTAAEGRERARKHRERKHPEAKMTPRRRRKAIPARMTQAVMTEQDKAEIEEERRKRMFLIGIDE